MNGTPASSQIIWLENKVKEQADEIERLREVLEKLSCNCTSNCDWDFDGEICPSWVARAAIKGDE